MRQIYSPLDGFRSPFGRLMGSTAPFTPAALFALAEPGVWYDPSDVANLAWRRNLLTFTEQFDNAVWTKSDVTVSSTQFTAPNGTTTADKVIASATSAVHFIRQAVSPVNPNSSYATSVYLKADEYTSAAIALVQRTAADAYIGQVTVSVNLSDGTYTTSTGGTPPTSAVYDVTPVGSGWYRVTISAVLAATAGIAWSIAYPNQVTSFTGNGTSGILIWGAQLELGSVATDYQRISDVNTEVIERFPSATLYQDTAGTTPVTTPGQTVALALDKSKGLVLGSELIPDASFDSAGSWTAQNTDWVVSGGKATYTKSAVSLLYLQSNANVSLQAGRFYEVRYTISGMASGNASFALFDKADTVNLFAGYITHTSNGEYVRRVLVSSSVTGIRIYAANSGTATSWSLDSFSVKELPGFHATQATLASRPTYGIVPLGGRRNLLTFSEDFSNAVWSKSGTTASAHTVADPVGGNTASTITATTSNGFFFFNTAANPTVTSTASLWIRRRTGTGAVRLRTNPVGPTETEITVTSSWQRVSVVVTPRNANDNLWVLSLVTSGDAVDVWHPQLETGSSATAYQRVGSAFDVTEAGVASLSYLSFDGVDDFLVTPTITPGIDKAQIFAGVRKLSTTGAYNALVEFSATPSINGTIWVGAPNTIAPAQGYSLESKGSVISGAFVNSGFASPISNVIAGISDISGDTVTLRVNGVQAAQSTTDQGTGNFLAYPFYIGRRGGTSLPFNGHIYGLIVRFGTNLDAGTITSTETWVNGKTGAYT